MIVLVIAAVILLIVFLAVPALQRNSRNTQRKKDATRLSIAAQEWRASNSNVMPSVCVPGFWCPAPGSTQRSEIIGNVGTFNFYDATGNEIWILVTSTTTDLTTASGGTWDSLKNADMPLIASGSRCDQGTTLSVGSEVAIVYTVEKSNATMSLACV